MALVKSLPGGERGRETVFFSSGRALLRAQIARFGFCFTQFWVKNARLKKLKSNPFCMLKLVEMPSISAF